MCNNVCHACRKVHEEVETVDWLHCGECHRFFRGQECFDLHKVTTAMGIPLATQSTDVVTVTKL
jgi:hypothetical protein